MPLPGCVHHPEETTKVRVSEQGERKEKLADFSTCFSLVTALPRRKGSDAQPREPAPLAPGSLPSRVMHRERVRHVTYPHSPSVDQHGNHVEPVCHAAVAVPIHPGERGPRQLSTLAPVHRRGRISEGQTSASLDLDEGYGGALPDDEIEVPVAGAPSPREYAPTGMAQPALRNSLSQFAQLLAGRLRPLH